MKENRINNKSIEDLKSLEQRISSSPNASSIYLASSPIVVRNAIKYSGFLEETSKENSTLASDLLQICLNKGINPDSEQFFLCVSFYLFAHVGLKESTNYILSYLQQHKREVPTGWTGHFATHALKILTNQKDTNEEYMFYRTDEREDTIKRALIYLTKK